MEFKTETSKVEIKINGKAYQLDRPKMKHQRLLEGITIDIKEGQAGTIEKTCNYLVSLGLPLEVVEDLDQDVVVKIIEYVSGVKKS